MTTKMKPLARKESDRIHAFTRTHATGERKTYHYKLFRVYHDEGNGRTVSMRATTVSMDWQQYLELSRRLKATQRQFSDAMRAGARILISGGTVDESRPFSAQVRAKCLDILTAKQMGVSLEDFEHAKSNNNAWSA